jgi:hypothetical protein
MKTLIASLVFLTACAGTWKVSANRNPAKTVPSSARFVVVPSSMGGSRSVVLPDLLATELMGRGLTIIERTALSQIAQSRGLDLMEILNGQMYFKLGQLAQADYVVIVSAVYDDSVVLNSSARVIEAKTGEIVTSVNFQNPTSNPSYVKNLGMNEIAQKMSEELTKVLK